jgi:hypothetical protein
MPVPVAVSTDPDHWIEHVHPLSPSKMMISDDRSGNVNTYLNVK